MATYERLDYGSPDGAQIGGASTDLWATHGAVPCDQAAYVADISSGTLQSGFGFSTSAQLVLAITAINAIMACLREKGLMASS